MFQIFAQILKTFRKVMDYFNINFKGNQYKVVNCVPFSRSRES